MICRWSTATRRFKYSNRENRQMSSHETCECLPYFRGSNTAYPADNCLPYSRSLRAQYTCLGKRFCLLSHTNNVNSIVLFKRQSIISLLMTLLSAWFCCNTGYYCAQSIWWRCDFALAGFVREWRGRIDLPVHPRYRNCQLFGVWRFATTTRAIAFAQVALIT